MRNSIKLHSLVNTCVLLAQQSTKIIKALCQDQAAIHSVQKGLSPADVCTEADLRIQKTIQHNLERLYPSSKVVCEEDPQAIPDSYEVSIQPDDLLQLRKEKIFTNEVLANCAKQRRGQYVSYLSDLLELNYSFIDAHDVKTGLENQFIDEVEESELTFYVDPLDGSSGLT